MNYDRTADRKQGVNHVVIVTGLRVAAPQWFRYLAVLVLVASVLTACGSAETTPARERAVVNRYKGWTVSVVPTRIDGSLWRARVRVWPPEVQPAGHPAINVSFDETRSDRGAIEQAGLAAARRYIDASQPVHQQQ